MIGGATLFFGPTEGKGLFAGTSAKLSLSVFLFPFAEADNGDFFVFVTSIATTPTLFLLAPVCFVFFFFFFALSPSLSSSSPTFSSPTSSSPSRGRILALTVVWFPIFIVLPSFNALASECSSNSTSSTYVPFELPRSTISHRLVLAFQKMCACFCDTASSFT